jgi:hypothetical protein
MQQVRIGLDRARWVAKLAPVVLGGAVVAFAPLAGAALVAHWVLDDGAGSTAADSSGNGFAADLFGATWGSDGQRSSFLTFSGNVGSYANTNVPLPIHTLTSDFSFALWANRAVGDTEPNAVVFGNRFASATNVDASPRQFVKLTNTQFEWHMNANGNDNVDIPDLVGGEWHHHAVVKTGAQIDYYLDGALTATDTLTQAMSVAQPLYFGGDGGADGGGEFFNGSLDDIRVYDHALSAAEVAAIIPEPTASVLALLGGALFALRRNRR